MLRATYSKMELVVRMVDVFNPHDGTGFGKCYAIKNFETILDFLTEVEKVYPDIKVHIIWDNLSAHKKAKRI